MDKNSIKSKLCQKVDHHLAWGIMGGVLIIVLTLGIVAACAAVENKEGVTATIVIGAIALFVLLAAVAFYYIKYYRLAHAEEVAIEPAEEQAAQEAEEAPVAEEVTAEAEEEAEEAVQEEVAEEVAAEAVEEAQAEEAGEAEVQEEAEEAEEAAQEETAQEEQAAQAEEEIAEEPVVEEPEEPAVVITAEEAHATMSDEEALALIEVRSKKPVDGPMCTVNVGILSSTFEKGEEVTLYALQAKGLIPRKQNGYIVLAEGSINKPLTIIANDFSADAVKMIVAAGGKAIGC